MLRSAPSYRGGSASLVSRDSWQRNLLPSIFPPLPELTNPFLSRLAALPLWYALGRRGESALERSDAAQPLQPQPLRKTDSGHADRPAHQSRVPAPQASSHVLDAVQKMWPSVVLLHHENSAQLCDNGYRDWNVFTTRPHASDAKSSRSRLSGVSLGLSGDKRFIPTCYGCGPSRHLGSEKRNEFREEAPS